jgi:hypothetical protein
MAISRFKTSSVAQGLPKYQKFWDQTTTKTLQNWATSNVGTSDIRGFIAKPDGSVGVAYTYIGTGSGNGAYYSTNGTTWTQATGYVNGCLGMTWDGTQFYGLSYAGGLKLTSTNGSTWSSASVSISTNYSSVAYGNSVYVGVDRNGYAYYSSNGTSYTSVALWGVGSDPKITFGNGLFATIKDSSGGSTTYYTSSNGSSWTSRTAPAAPNFISYANNLWFLTTASGTTYYTSTDGINWTTRTGFPAARIWGGVSYANGIYVSMAREGNLSAYSLDGITWTSKAFTATGTYNGNDNPSQGAVNNYIVYPNDSIYINYAKVGL